MDLWPLAQCEIEGRASNLIDHLFARAPFPTALPPAKTPLIDRILAGGFPEPVTRLSATRRAAWYNSYTTTLLKRDVRDLSAIEGLADLPRLLTLLASRVAGLLNYADLARTIAVPQTTLKRYFALLHAMFLVHTIPAWEGNHGLRLAKSPKIALPDTGLACHLLGLDAARLAGDRNLLGPFTENFVSMELLRLATWSSTSPRLHHFRDPAGREVDIVLETRSGGRCRGYRGEGRGCGQRRRLWRAPPLR